MTTPVHAIHEIIGLVARARQVARESGNTIASADLIESAVEMFEGMLVQFTELKNSQTAQLAALLDDARRMRAAAADTLHAARGTPAEEIDDHYLGVLGDSE